MDQNERLKFILDEEDKPVLEKNWSTINESIVREIVTRKQVVQRAGKMKPNNVKGTNTDDVGVGEQEQNGATRTSSKAYFNIKGYSESHGIVK